MPVVTNFASLISTLQAYMERGDSVTDPTVYANIPLIVNNGERRLARALKIQGFETYVNGAFQAGLSVYAKPALWRDTIAINFGTGPVLSVISRSTAANVRTLTFQQPTALIPGIAPGLVVTVSGMGGNGYNGTFNVVSVGFSSVTYASAGGNEGATADVGYMFAPAKMNSRRFLRNRSLEVVKRYWPDPTQTDEPRWYSDYGLNNILVAPTPKLPYPFEFGFWQLPQQLDAINQTNYFTDFVPDLLLYSCCVEMEPFLKEDTRIPVWKGMYDEGLANLAKEEVMKIQDRAANRTPP